MRRCRRTAPAITRNPLAVPCGVLEFRDRQGSGIGRNAVAGDRSGRNGPVGTSASAETLSRTKPFLSNPEDPHVRAVASNANAVLGDVPVRGTRGGSDAGHFHAGGTRAVKFGPGGRDSNVHDPDENLALDQLRDAAVVVAASVRDIGRGRS